MRRFPPLALAALLALAGCGRSPPSVTLTLDAAPAPAATQPGYRGPPVAVPAVHLPAAVDRAEFVRQARAGTLEVDDFARWAAPLGTLARDALVRDLTQRLPAGSVLPPGATAAAGRAAVYDVTILSLDLRAGGTGMQAAFRRLPGGAPRVVAYADDRPAADAPASATALAALLGRLADDIAADAAGAPPR